MKLLLVLIAVAFAVVVGGGLLTTQWDAGATSAAVACVVDGTADGAPSMSSAQSAVVDAILGSVRELGIERRGATIALQTAMQESTLRADVVVGEAVGAFQQIAPGPFGAYAGYDRTDPGRATAGFFSVLLRRIPGYASDPRPNHELAQVVQASGAGAAWYARHQKWAESVVAVRFNSGSGCVEQVVEGPVPVRVKGNTVELPAEAKVTGTVVAASERVAKAVGAALAWLGTPYSWGGGDENGPTKGVRDGGVADAHGDFDKVGFDCSGLTLYAYAQAGKRITRPSDAQLTGAELVVPFAQARSGDLLFWGTHHVAMYLGVFDGVHRMVEAPQSGDVVEVSPVRLDGDFRGVAARPIP
ncbi:NlpC/P60 family protein [Actinosynnema sp. NPDC023587]|uniref:C40 family peptidase n=1 Tax=Actinosynnema sp. NPDC023587 TaxID=3154695 RepID=UPI0033D0A50C